MTDQPARVSPGEISGLLDQLRGLPPDAPLAERLAWHERKADVLSRIADQTGDPEARQVAADARAYMATLATQYWQEVTR